jgi:flagellar FliL protein
LDRLFWVGLCLVGLCLEVVMSEQDDDAVEDGEEEPKKKKLSGKVLVLFVILPLLLVIAGGAAAAYFLLFASADHADGGGDTGKDGGDGSKKNSSKKIVFYDMPEMLVNMNSRGRRKSFLKIKVSLELESEAAIPKLEAVLPRIIDNFQVYLRELRLEDLKGSAGLLRLKEELLLRINLTARPIKVNDVLFKEMLVQ